MKKSLRAIALILFLGGAGFWLAAGANLKWTKTSVEKRTLDEVTGLEGITYEKKFVPGIDFLVAADVVASILLIASFLFRNKTEPSQPTTNHTP